MYPTAYISGKEISKSVRADFVGSSMLTRIGNFTEKRLITWCVDAKLNPPALRRVSTPQISLHTNYPLPIDGKGARGLDVSYDSTASASVTRAANWLL